MQYSPKAFFRHVPNHLLSRYFTERDELTDFPWDEVEDGSDVESLFDAWMKIDSVRRGALEVDLRRAVGLATPAGIAAIIEHAESPQHGLDLRADLEALEGTCHKAFWTLVHHEAVFRVASLIQHAERINAIWWVRRTDLPTGAPDDSERTKTALAEELKAYFRRTQGRGDACFVETFVRGEHEHYFFAYPSDYADTLMEFDEFGTFQRNSHKPAFEVIFVFHAEDGTLDLYGRGNQKVKTALQECFGRAILGCDLGPEPYRKHAYVLDGLRDRNFEFTTPVEDHATVDVLQIRLSAINGHGRVELQANPERGAKSVYTFMDEALALRERPLSEYHVTKARFRVEFNPPGEESRAVEFNVTHPRWCGLGDDPDDVKIKDYLKDWGIARVDAASAPATPA